MHVKHSKEELLKKQLLLEELEKVYRHIKALSSTCLAFLSDDNGLVHLFVYKYPSSFFFRAYSTILYQVPAIKCIGT